jgi:hypothetical protein
MGTNINNIVTGLIPGRHESVGSFAGATVLHLPTKVSTLEALGQ